MCQPAGVGGDEWPGVRADTDERQMKRKESKREERIV